MTAALDVAAVTARVHALPDPELPFVTLGELGVIHRVFTGADGRLEVQFIPTFLGCPALRAIAADIATALASCGHPDGRVRQVLSPPWTSERITASGRRALAEHGIAPPAPRHAPRRVRLGFGTPCPTCGSQATRPHSAFGPSRCQSILLCLACQETFPQLATV
ncbi:1,2-phenylacetyl-CoA epoxidase subunit PaaD [Streptomyces sp. NPDC051014]|uniref:1,2-phenylacetyl-CoA epoxidase subunit PaaD n=1 Tax=Streptomyces sp. NPDC051014 TaxID=3155751 RepID=UPI0033D6D524